MIICVLKDNAKPVVLEWKEENSEVGPSESAKLRRERIIAYIEAAGLAVDTIQDEGNYFHSIIVTGKR